MRWKVLSVFCVFFLLAGCSKTNSSLDKAISVRNKLLSGNGCTFSASITADYGSEIYDFAMDCQADKDGNLTFSVVRPDSINGISGRITNEGGAITFDDTVLAFPMLAEGQLTPVSAPWILVKTLRSGYLNGCANTQDGIKISIDDSYAAEALHLEILSEDSIPTSAEIYWQGRRVLTLVVENFTYL